MQNLETRCEKMRALRTHNIRFAAMHDRNAFDME